MPATFGLLFKHYIRMELAKWKITLFETVTVLLMLLIIMINPILYSKRLLYRRHYYAGDHTVVSHKLEDIHILTKMLDSKREQTKYQLAYTPKSRFVKQVVDVVAYQLELNGTIGYNTAKDLYNQFDDRTTLAGIVFDNMDASVEEPPKVLSVSIRFPYEFRTLRPYLTEDRLWITRCSGFVNARRDNVKDTDNFQDIYIREAFLQLQHQVFQEWYHSLRSFYPSSYTEPDTEVFNIRRRVVDERCTPISMHTVPLFLFSFLYMLPFINITRYIGHHVNNGVMTHQWHNGYSFLKQYFIIITVSWLRLFSLNLFMTIVIFVGWWIQVIKTFGFALPAMIVFVMIFTFELIVMGIILGKIFGNATNAMVFAIIIWLLNYSVFGIILKRYWQERGYYIYIVLILFFNNQLPYAIEILHRVIDEPLTIKPYDIAILYISTVISTFIYFLILFILQCQKPGRLVSSRILCSKRISQKKFDPAKVHMARIPKWHHFEFGDVGSQEVLSLNHIYTKHRSKSRVILNNVTMRFYLGETYVILGHIGSGKVTLMRIICGLKYPVYGTVTFLGEDIYPDLRKYRKFIDFRSAENGLNLQLSIEQTINYHVRVKLQPSEMGYYNIERMRWIDLLESYSFKRTAKIGRISSGGQRLVALCCALAGNIKIVVLEEPTMTLTAKETKIFWSIIEMEKEDRSIIVTTHSIDEANAIGDRIGILSMGVLEASGTPFFLRTKFSNNVELVLIKKPSASEGPITEFISKYIPDVEAENEIGDTLIYRIDMKHRPLLQKMLIHLEKDGKSLGVENIRVLGSELFDIYMEITGSFPFKEQVVSSINKIFRYAIVSKNKLQKQQLRAMLYKKMIHSAPNVWPLIMIFTSLIIVMIIKRVTVVLNVPLERHMVIPLGFKGASDYIKDIPDIRECGFVEIRVVTKVITYKSSLSRLFGPNAFLCSEGRYKQSLLAKSELFSLGAIEMDGEQLIRAYISQDIFHSAPMTLNLLHNSILRLTYPNDTDFQYLVDNHPMPPPLIVKINLPDNEVAHIYAPLTIGSVLPLLVSVFILPLVEDHISQMRILQTIAGLGLRIYWGVTIFWDYFTYVMYVIIIIIIIACTHIGELGAYENLVILLLISTYGLAAIPITYLLAIYVNQTIVKAFLVSICVQLFIGLALYVIYWEVANSNRVFFYIACFSPGFSLLNGVSNVYIIFLEKRFCGIKCSSIEYCTPENMHVIVPHCSFDSYFSWADTGIMLPMVYMVFASATILLIILWIEVHRKEIKFNTTKDLRRLRSATNEFDDNDVADVKQKIAEADMSKCKESVFLVDQLEGKIPSRNFRVNTVSFALDKYMSMGIFGPRRSGKSHLIRQLVGLDGFYFGEIYVRGFDFKYDLKKILEYVGYCPQHTGLLNQLTPREHIRMLCMIRGVSELKINEKIHDICLLLNMTGWMHRKCGTLTAEKRRKVNVALAMVAYNKIFILDEPTWGMPATTRREIWNLLRYLRYSGKTIIFSTSDELECKILADFIILFQDSEMLAIGSMQYLRYKFSQGFYLEVRLIRDGSTVEESENNLRKDMQNLTRFVYFLHDQSELIARLGNWFKYYIPVEHILYSFLYGTMEKNKVRLNISDYSINQTNLHMIISYMQEARSDLKHLSFVPIDPEIRTSERHVITKRYKKH